DYYCGSYRRGNTFIF
nr:immunoglobulin light chain junction region [Macaca mulatta]